MDVKLTLKLEKQLVDRQRNMLIRTIQVYQDSLKVI